MKITRNFVEEGSNPYLSVSWSRRNAEIIDDGTNRVVYKATDLYFPETWSQASINQVSSKYFRKEHATQSNFDSQASIHTSSDDEVWGPIYDKLRQLMVLGHNLFSPSGAEVHVAATVHRIVGCWTWWGVKHNYFDSSEDAIAYYDEMAYMMINQMGAPNSPQWFNTGIYFAYGEAGEASGTYWADFETGELHESTNAYEHPMPHACFILKVKDSLTGDYGLLDIAQKEGIIFKFGGGVGADWSDVREEGAAVSGGGVSSGVLSFERSVDYSAGAIKSGGRTRRAARMVTLKVDHPDIEKFIDCKVIEEEKALALAKMLNDWRWDGEAWRTVAYQNANHSVRIPNSFMEAVGIDGEWDLISRTKEGMVLRKVKARSLWDKMNYAEWRVADPGKQYHTTINEWHTCAADGEIDSSNPCSEYLFLNLTSCNLGSLNLIKFYDLNTRVFNIAAFLHATHLWTIMLDISVTMAQLPSKEVAQRTWEYRTLGLGYAGLGRLLRYMGIPYDSEEGRAWGRATIGLMTAKAYETSAEMAAQFGPFPGYERNMEHMLRVLRNHQQTVINDMNAGTRYDYAGNYHLAYDGLSIKPYKIAAKHYQPYILEALSRAWDRALDIGMLHGYRNAQTTVIAPTGTISYPMDIFDSTAGEPIFAQVAVKTLAGGGSIKIAARGNREALLGLGYPEWHTDVIEKYIVENGTIEGAPGLKEEHLPVFDCANESGTGKRYLRYEAHVLMLSAQTPQVSGAVSKTVNLPNHATVQQINDLQMLAWKTGVKALAVYRNGSKGSQPLNTSEDQATKGNNEKMQLGDTNDQHCEYCGDPCTCESCRCTCEDSECACCGGFCGCKQCHSITKPKQCNCCDGECPCTCGEDEYGFEHCPYRACDCCMHNCDCKCHKRRRKSDLSGCCSCNSDIVCADDMDLENGFCPCKAGTCTCECHFEEQQEPNLSKEEIAELMSGPECKGG